jgi:hypothetical protein
MEIKFRNVVTIIVIAGLVGGSGASIIYDAFENPEILTSRTTAPDGTITETFEQNNLAKNNIFNIWLGAVLGFGGAIIAVLYKQQQATGEG